jgi:hypothetical protein
MAISTNGVVLTRLAGALYNQQLSNATYNEVLTGFNSPTALNTLANYLISVDFASRTDLQIATTLVTNLSLTAVAGLDNWIAAQLTAAGSGNKGAKIISLLNDFSNISTADATYGTAVAAFNTKIDAAQALSQTSGNAGSTFLAVGTTTSALTFTLTTGIDNGTAFTGGNGADTFNATHLTFGASDALVGGAGIDTLTIVDTGTAAFTLPVASVSGIENINLRNLNGTAAVAAVTGVTAVNETQTVTVAGANAVGTSTFFLGITTTVTAGDTPATVAGLIAANKANIMAGPVAVSLGVTDISVAGAVLTITFGGANGKGDVPNMASSATSNGATFTAGTQVTQGVVGVAAVSAVAATSQTDTLDATKFTDATTFTSDSSTGLVNITGLTAAQTAVKKAGAGGLGAGFGATVTSGTVEINGGSTAGAVDITGAAFTTATINSTGAANTIGTLTGAATTTTSTTINATTALTTGAATNLGATVTVNGAGNVSFGTTALEAGVTTLNAAALTGTLTVALGSAATQKVTGGAGADVISTGAVLTTGSVDAGVGTDVLVLTNATHLANTTLAAKYTNFETLRINTGITQDMANAPAGITAVQTMGVATVSNMTAAQAGAVQMRTNATAGTADALSFALASAGGTSDVLTIVSGVGTTTTGALDIAALTVTGFETLNIQANPGPSSTAGAAGAGDRTTFITGTITGATLNTINLTGTAVNIANIAIANGTAGVTINGSALTGDGLAAASQAGLTVAGSAFVGSTINGSAVRDVFTIGAEGSAYNGGAGNDRMTTSVAILAADGVTDGTMNGGDGTDTLVLSDTTTTMSDNHFIKLSNFETLTLSNTTGDASITTGGSFNSAFPNGATITTGTLAATKDITFAGGLATVPVTITVDATLITGAATDTQSVITGSAADTVTLTTTAATYVGVAGANNQGTVVISTNAGADTITFNYGQLLANAQAGFQAFSITGGTGADTITKGTGSLNSTTVTSTTVFNMAAGDSGTTLATQDKITGFSLAGVAAGTLSDVLNFEGTATVSAFTSSIDFGTILTHSITGGIATFDTAATFASAKVINANNLADVVGYLNANLGVNETVGFLYDSNSDGANDATMVFHQGSSLTTVADDLVQLVGTTGLSLNATLTTTTAGCIAIA